jgi:hypothetical protein
MFFKMPLSPRTGAQAPANTRIGMPQGRQLPAHNQVFLGSGRNHFVIVQVQLSADLRR